MRISSSTGERMSNAARAAVGLALLALTVTACGNDDPGARVGDLSDVTVAGQPSAPPATPASPSPTTPTPASAGAQPGATVVDVLAELEVEDQRGDGTSARVEFARLSSGTGHVAISTRDGQLLGSAPVTQGAQPVTIPLSPRVTASGELLAVLYADDGDGAFDAARDPVVVDNDGEREREDFDYVLS